MRILVAIMAVAVACCLYGCPSARQDAGNPRTGNVKSAAGADQMLVNGAPMKLIPWSDAAKTTIELDMSELRKPDLPSARYSELMRSGPWWLWPEIVKTAKLEYGKPASWNEKVHGLYVPRQNQNGNKLVLTKDKFIPPDRISEKSVEYDWATVEKNAAVLSHNPPNPDALGIYYMLVTPQQTGCYLSCSAEMYPGSRTSKGK